MTPFQSPKSTKNRPKSLQNWSLNPSKTAQERHLILQTPKINNNATLLRFCSFLTFQDLRKSSQNRCQNALKISFILDTLLEPQKIRFLMLKRRQDGRPKFLFFFSKIVQKFYLSRSLVQDASWKPPRACQEPPGSLPRAVQGPSRGTQVPSRRSLQPPKRRLRGAQKAKRPVLELDPRRKEMSPVDQSIIGNIDR